MTRTPLSLLLGPATLAALGLAASHPQAARAQTIYNFQQATRGAQYVGQGALGAGGTFFNAISNPTTSNAKDSNGNASTVGLTLANPGNSDAYPTNPYNNVLIDQYFYNQSGSPADFTITNLAANAPFQIYLYGIDGGYHDRGTIFSLTDSTFTTVSATASDRNTTDASFVQGDNYVILTGTTDANGSVFGTLSANPVAHGGNNNEFDFNGLQIEVSPAPEPSAFAGLALGALGLAGLGWKARKRA